MCLRRIQYYTSRRRQVSMRQSGLIDTASTDGRLPVISCLQGIGLDQGNPGSLINKAYNVRDICNSQNITQALSISR